MTINGGLDPQAGFALKLVLVGGRVSDEEGLGSFKVTYGTDNNLKLDEFQASALTYGLWTGAWDLAGFGDTDFNADPDRDGIRNGLEYALGMDPLTSDAALAPTVSVLNVSGSKYLALTYVRQAGVNLPTDLLFAVERSTNLSAPNGGWSPTGVIEQSVTTGPEAGFETVVVRSSTPMGTPGVKSEFLRLSVTLTP